MTEIGYDDRTRAPAGGGAVKQTASTAVDAASTAASDTASTAKDQAKQVAGEVKVQARNIASDVRSRVGSEARTQNDRLADTIRGFVDELDQMVSERGDSPARSVVTQVSQGGRRFADYLSERGPEGVLDEVQDFARRRPGTFLAVAAAAGFVAGRLGKTALGAAREDTSTKPLTDTYVATAPVTTTPSVVESPTAYTGAPAPVVVPPHGTTQPTATYLSSSTADDLPGTRP